MTFRELLESKKVSFKDKTELRRSLSKSRGLILSWNLDGSWVIGDKAELEANMEVSNILDYYSWNYNVSSSISQAIKDIERGRFDISEVDPR